MKTRCRADRPPWPRRARTLLVLPAFLVLAPVLAIAAGTEPPGDLSVAVLENQVRIFPGDRALKARLAATYAADGRMADALRVHRELRGGAPGLAGDVALLAALRGSRYPGDRQLADHLLGTWPSASLGVLRDEDLEVGARLARERGDVAGAASFQAALAHRRPQDAGVVRAWLAAVEAAGGDPSEAMRAAWRLDPRDPALLAKILEKGSPALREEALGSYAGPRDGAVRVLLVRAAAERGDVDAAWTALHQLDTASRGGLADVAARLARDFLARGRLDRVRWLGDHFSFPAGLRGEAARAALAAGRLEDAGHFGETGPRIALALARRAGDTRAVALLLEELWATGAIDAGGLGELAVIASTPGKRRLAALCRSIRGGPGPGGARSAGTAMPWRDPRARVLLGDPLDRAEAFLELGLAKRAAGVLLAGGVDARRGDPGKAAALLVSALVASGRETEARSWLSPALRHSPDAIDLRELAYRAAEAAEDEVAMTAHLEAILEADTSHAFARRTLPSLYVQRAVAHFRDRPRALAILEKALALDPASPVAHYNLALLYAMNGDSDRALSHVAEVILRNPRDVAAQTLAASLYRGRGDQVRAVAAYRASIDAGASPAARQELALLLWQQGDSNTALAAAGEAWRLEKENPQFARTYGLFGARLGRSGEVREALESAYREYPGDREVAAAWAEALLTAGKPSRARQVMLTHPDKALRASVMGRAWMREGKPDLAVVALRPYRDHAACRAAYLAALAQLADLRLSERNLEAAKASWREWLQFDPRATVPRALLAAADPRGAGEEVGGSAPLAAPTMAPVAAPAPASSGTAASRTVPETGRRLVPAASPAVPAAATPGSASGAAVAPGGSARDMMRSAAEALRSGDVARSAALARRATELAPRDPVAWNLLALAASRQGRTADAVAAFERSLSLKPEQDEVREALQELRNP